MRISYLREFIICAKVKNFTKAAELLYVTQPVLSKHMAQLEMEIGASLFLRTTPLTLTKAGAYLLSKIEHQLQEYETILKETAALGQGYSGNLGFGILYYTKDVIMPAIAHFTKTYPDIKLHYQFSTPYEILEAVINRAVDVACIQQVELPNHDELQFYELYPEPFVMICSPEHRFSAKEMIQVNDLKAEKYIQVKDGFYAAFLKFINNRCAGYDISIDPSFYVSNFEELLMAVQLNQGISIVAEALVKVDLGIRYIHFMEADLCFIRSLAYRLDNENPNLKLFLHSLT